MRRRTAVPEVTLPMLELEAESLHDQEVETLLALGEAHARGLPGNAARAELRRIREELEVRYAAQRFLAAAGLGR